MQKPLLGLAALALTLSACTPATTPQATTGQNMAPGFLAQGQQWRMSPQGQNSSTPMILTVGAGAAQKNKQYAYVQRTPVAGGITIVDSFEYAPATATGHESLSASTWTVTSKISASLRCVVVDPSRHPKGPYIGLYVLLWGDPARDATATALVNTYIHSGQFPVGAPTCLLARTK